MSEHDPATGEITTDGPANAGYAVDGRVIPAAALTGGQFLDLLEEGQVSADMHHGMKDLVAEMTDIARQTNGAKVKGKLAINVEFSLEDGAFRIATAFKITKPTLPRPKSIMWTDEHNRFTRFPPNQGQFFGVRSVGGNSAPRSV